MLPSGGQCSIVPMSLVVRTQHSAMAFLLVLPLLIQCTNSRVCAQIGCMYGVRFVSMRGDVFTVSPKIFHPYWIFVVLCVPPSFRHLLLRY